MVRECGEKEARGCPTGRAEEWEKAVPPSLHTDPAKIPNRGKASVSQGETQHPETHTLLKNLRLQASDVAALPARISEG